MADETFPYVIGRADFIDAGAEQRAQFLPVLRYFGSFADTDPRWTGLGQIDPLRPFWKAIDAE